MIQTPRMVSSGVMQLHRGYEEVITPAGVQPPTRQYRCSIDLYAGRIPAPQHEPRGPTTPPATGLPPNQYGIGFMKKPDRDSSD